MSGIALAWTLALGALAAFLPLHVLAIRLTGERYALAKSVVCAVAAGAGLMFAAPKAASLAGESPASHLLLHSGALYLFLSLLILSFYSALDHSVRIRLCVEIVRSEKRELTLAEILARYRPDQAASRRRDKLVYGGYASKEGAAGTLRLTRKGRAAASVRRAARRVYGLK